MLVMGQGIGSIKSIWYGFPLEQLVILWPLGFTMFASDE